MDVVVRTGAARDMDVEQTWRPVPPQTPPPPPVNPVNFLVSEFFNKTKMEKNKWRLKKK